MQKYFILHAQSAGQLVMEVNDFFDKNPQYKLTGGPYSDSQNHYQCVVLKSSKELMLLG